ncbi:MAG: pantoate--beta-alanine ligase [Acetobacteraceae bacterium]
MPTVRDADGLALSSRNRFLSAEERKAAAHLPAVLLAACEQVRAEGPAALGAARLALEAAGFSVDYLDLVDSVTLERLAEVRAGSRLLAAARLGSVRLLDNMAVA